MWQDYILLFGAFVFAALLLPTLRDSGAAVPRLTSVPTASILVVYAITFWTLGLHLSAAGNLFTAVAWVGIALWRAPRRTDDSTDGPVRL